MQIRRIDYLSMYISIKHYYSSYQTSKAIKTEQRSPVWLSVKKETFLSQAFFYLKSTRDKYKHYSLSLKVNSYGLTFVLFHAKSRIQLLGERSIFPSLFIHRLYCRHIFDLLSSSVKLFLNCLLLFFIPTPHESCTHPDHPGATACYNPSPSSISWREAQFNCLYKRYLEYALPILS